MSEKLSLEELKVEKYLFDKKFIINVGADFSGISRMVIRHDGELLGLDRVGNIGWPHPSFELTKNEARYLMYMLKHFIENEE